jgi:signal transduction histidine kinase
MNQYEQSLLMRLAGISNSLALQIDGEKHAQIFNKYKNKNDIRSVSQDPNYQEIFNILKANYDANMLKSPIYTIVLNQEGNFYEFGITSDSIPYFRHPYISSHSILQQKYNIGAMIPAYSDEYGMWLSAFSPIKNRKGQVVAVVMADEKLNDFHHAINTILWRTFLFSFLVFAAVITVLMWLLQKILRSEQKDRELISIAHNTIKNINEDLSIANEKLIDQDLFRKEMITNISHDLRTPLASMIGYSDVLKSKHELLTADEKKKYYDIVHSESLRLNNLVNDLFELSKLESGQVVIQSEPFSVYELISDIIQKYYLVLKDKNVELKYDITNDLGLAFGDIKYIDRLIQNLFDNAVRYVNIGGFIKVTIQDLDMFFKIKICNSGDPIAKESLDNIFERYYTGNRSDYQRAGLGLAIARNICSLHGCTITAESSEGVNTFWFTLPKAKSE